MVAHHHVGGLDHTRRNDAQELNAHLLVRLRTLKVVGRLRRVLSGIGVVVVRWRRDQPHRQGRAAAIARRRYLSL